MDHKLKRRVTIKVKEFSKVIKAIKDCGLKIIQVGYRKDYPSIEVAERMLGTKLNLSEYAIIEERLTKIEVTTKWYDPQLRPTTYICSLNDEDIFAADGHKCFCEMQKSYKIPRADEHLAKYLDPETGKYVCSASPIIGYNEKYNRQVLYDCYEYDINSAYSSVLLSGIPDLYRPMWAFRKVKPGEVGFLLDDQLTLIMPGNFADVIFPFIKCPRTLAAFIQKWYDKKKATKGNEHLEAKAMLNLPVGYSQRYNPFLRAYVVHRCNYWIRNIIDENTLFWNTDAIYSKTRRNDLKIGDSISCFKEIHIKRLIYKENTYQVDSELPTYRGVPKSWFKRFEKEHGRPFNIIEDDLPKMYNKYRFNSETLKLEDNSHGI